MKIGKMFISLSSLALISTAASAALPEVKAGAQVFDASGAAVGTVEAVSGNVATVSTGTNKAGLPLSAFGQGDKGLVIGMTKAELDAAATAATAKAVSDIRAQLSPGAVIYGADNVVVATVETVDADFATLNVGEAKAKLPLSAFTIGAQGPQIAMTSAQLKAAVAAQTPAARP